MIDEDLRTFMATLVPANTVIEKGWIDQTATPAKRIFYQRSEANHEVDLAGNGLLYETLFDVEVAALEDDATCQTLAQDLKGGPDANTHGLNGYRGRMGDANTGTFTQYVCTSDHSDSYEPRLLDADEGYSIASFQVLVIHETP
jgi:hypothetical protein